MTGVNLVKLFLSYLLKTYYLIFTLNINTFTLINFEQYLFLLLLIH